MKPSRKLVAISGQEDQRLAEQIAGFHRHVYFYCLRLLKNKERQMELAEDLAQETMFKAMRSRHTYDGSAALMTWLFQIAKFACYDHFRNYRRRTWAYSEPLECLEQIQVTQTPPTDVLSAVAFEQAMENLPVRYRKIVLLYKEGLQYVEIAHTLGIPEGTAKSRLHRAKSLMHKHLTPA